MTRVRDHLNPFAFLLSPFAATGLPYVAQKGDTLSSIAYDHLGTPVYGTAGSLEEILARNPLIQTADYITVGQKIELGLIAPTATNSPISESSERASIEQPPERVKAQPQRRPAEADPVEEGERVAAIRFAPRFEASKISSVDRSNGTSANLLSKANAGFGLAYSHFWSQKFKTHFYFGFQSVTFNDPQSSLISLKDNNAKLYRFGLDAELQVGEKTSFSVGVGNHQAIFLRATSTTQIVLDSISTPDASAQFNFEVLNRDPFSLNASLGARISTPMTVDTYQTRWNPAYFGRLSVGHQISRSWATELGVSGQYQTLNSSIVDQHQTDYGIDFSIQWFFTQLRKAAKP